jgi:hypothetical protein
MVEELLIKQIDFESLSKEEIINKCQSYIGICSRQQSKLRIQTQQIRNLRMMMLKIRNNMDNLLKHPYSTHNPNVNTVPNHEYYNKTRNTKTNV